MSNRSNTKNKKCDFSFALHDFDQVQRLKQEVFDFDIWAYIDHIPDDDNGSNHTHFYIHLKQPITISNLAEKLDLPENMIEWVRNKTLFIQYLIHKNQPEKTQYLEKDIVTNDTEFIHKFLFASVGTDLFSEFDDLRRLASGDITPYQYINEHSSSLKSLPFYSRQVYMCRLINLASQGEVSRQKKYIA